MEELLKSSKTPIKSFSQGDVVDAKLLEVGGTYARFDIGGKSEGVVQDSAFSEVREFISSLKVGDTVKSLVLDPESRDGLVILSLRHTAAKHLWKELHEIYNKNERISVVVKEVAGSGVTVGVLTTNAYIPASQLSKEHADDLESLVGQQLEVKIIELNREKNKVVLSERAILEEEDVKAMKRALKKASKGKPFIGKVVTLTPFGAFVEVEIEGTKVEGLVHVSEISWTKVNDPSEVLTVGDKVKVVVLGTEKDRLALSMKDAQEDPWEEIEKKYKVDDRLTGKIMNTSDFGAFVELSPGVEGLIHITKIPPGTNLKEGEDVQVYVEGIDPKERRISLGLILTTSKPVGYK